MKNTRKNKKGFTLVELIVVLVILAILAAILVPALLGWIDKAGNGQDIVDARALMNAVQAQMTEEYGLHCKKFSGFVDDKKAYDDVFMKGNDDEWGTFWEDALKFSGVEEPFVFLFYTKKISAEDIKKDGTTAALHDAYTIISAVYWRDPESTPIFYDFMNNSWEEGSPYSADLIKRGENKIQDGIKNDKRVRVCIAGGKSVNAVHDSNLNTRVNRIKNINNMILKVMDYQGTLNNTSSYDPNVKIE
nr:type II secretion system GspH family protein [Lachnospiraceae bacterium]